MQGKANLKYAENIGFFFWFFSIQKRKGVNKG